MSTTTVPALKIRAKISSLLNAIKTPSSLTVRPAVVGRTAPSKFCEVKTAPIWFPTKTGQTTLPPAPPKTVNSVSKPPNAVARPPSWDGQDLCLLFQDILPVAQEPVYGTELDVDYVYKPYDEVYPLLALVKTKIEARYFPYRLVNGPFEQIIKVNIGFGEIVKYPYDVTTSVSINVVVTSEVGLLPIRVVGVKIKTLAEPIGPTAAPVVLLHMDDFDGATEFVDEMGNVWVNEYAKISYQKEKIGVSVGDFLIPTSSISCDSEKINIGSNNFTLDFWFYGDSDRTESQCLYSTGHEDSNISDYGVYLNTDRNLAFFYKRDSEATGISVFSFANSVTDNEWHHVAICRQGNTLKCFLDGELKATSSLFPTSICGNAHHRIGNDAGNNYYIGYIDEVRLVLGLCLYDNEFEPETQPYEPSPLIKLARITVKSAIQKEFIYIGNKKEILLTLRTRIRSTIGYGFRPTVYLGSGSARTIDGLGLKPAFIWIKRSRSNSDWLAFDRLRGPFRSCSLSGTEGETEDRQSVVEFQDDGFVLGSSTSVNSYNQRYIAWAFAGSSAVTTISKQAVEDGYIAKCTTSIDVTTGVSYGYYESNRTETSPGIGSYVYHGFDSEPDLIFVLSLNSGRDPVVLGRLIGQDAYVTTSSTLPIVNENPRFSKYKYLNSRPDYFRVSEYLDGEEGNKYAFYAFKATPSRIATGEYAGGSNSDLRIETGFKPALLILRMRHSLTQETGFMIFDESRGWNKQLGFDKTGEIDTGTKITVDDTGFTIKAGSDLLATQTTYLYMAVAGSLTSPLISPPIVPPEPELPPIEPAILLHMDGPDGSTDFIDEAGNEWIPQFAYLSSAQEKIGASVAAFLDPTAQLYCNSPNIDVGSDDFTLEFWFYDNGTTLSYQCLYSLKSVETDSFDIGIYLLNGREIMYWYLYQSSDTGVYYQSIIRDSVNYGLSNAWHHFALCREGYMMYAFVDGQASIEGFRLSINSVVGGADHRIGNDSRNNFFTGYIDEVRLIKGLALYTAPFTPTEQPYNPAPSFKAYKLKLRTLISGELIYGNRSSETTLKIKVDACFTTGFNFKPITYTGSGASRTIAELGFRPMFTWIKQTTYDSFGLQVYDILRGPLKSCNLSNTSVESTIANSLTGFLQDGFTLGSASQVNQLNGSFASWTFGGNPVIRTSNKQAVDGGYIADAEYAVDATSGITCGYYYSNNTYSGTHLDGTYVPHGFSGEPDLVIAKGLRYNGSAFAVGGLIGDANYLTLPGAARVQIGSTVDPYYKYDESRPEYIKFANSLDRYDDNVYAYFAFKTTPGKVAAGKYAGDDSANVRIELGFKPAFLILKLLYSRTYTTGTYIYDAARGWDKQATFDQFATATVVDKLIVDETGFAVKAGQDVCRTGALYMYLAVAGTLTSPLTGSFFAVNLEGFQIQVAPGTPEIEIVKSLVIPTAEIYLLKGSATLKGEAALYINSGNILTSSQAPAVIASRYIKPTTIYIQANTGEVSVKAETSIAVPSIESLTYGIAPAIATGCTVFAEGTEGYISVWSPSLQIDRLQFVGSNNIGFYVGQAYVLNEIAVSCQSSQIIASTGSVNLQVDQILFASVSTITLTLGLQEVYISSALVVPYVGASVLAGNVQLNITDVVDGGSSSTEHSDALDGGSASSIFSDTYDGGASIRE